MTQDIDFPAGFADEVRAATHAHEIIFRHAWTRAIDRCIGAVVEPATAGIVLVEVFLLSAGIYARYVVDRPIAWIDEVAAMLFLWLTMLGAANAYRRDRHMQFTMLVDHVAPRWRGLLRAVSNVAVLIFCLRLIYAILIPDAVEWPADLRGIIAGLLDGDILANGYFGQEMIDYSTALHIPQSYSILGIVIGLGLVALLCILRLFDSKLATIASSLAVAFVAIALGNLVQPVLAELGNYNLLIFFILLLSVLIAIGVPIAFAFGIATLGYLSFATFVPESVVAGQMDEGMNNLLLLAVPLFVLLGLLMDAVGIARRLVEAVAAFIGHITGGLNIVLVVAMFLVSGISGSKLADMAAITPVLFPEMERRGYKRSEMISLLASSGAMAELIPPSLVLIIVGTVCNLSIQKLFIAGLLPAAIASACLVAVSFIRSRRDRLAAGARATYAERGRAFVVALPGLLLPFLIRYFVVAGITTATEVSTIGILYCVVVGIFIYRQFDWRKVYPMLKETADLTGAIVFITAMATAMGWALTQSGFAAELAAALEHAPGGIAGFLLLSIIAFIALGSVLEGIPAIVLFGPLLFPIARQLGIDEIHYAILAVLALSIGLFAPPLGVGYYSACAVGKCDPARAARAIMPYLAGLILALALLTCIPWLSTGFISQ